MGRAHAVGPGEGEPAHEPFLRPAVVDEVGGQPVEQFGVRGSVAAGAEVVDRMHDPEAEELLPDPVDGDPRGERIERVGDPVRHLQAAALIRGHRRCVRPRRHPQHATGHDGPGSPRVAADGDVGIGRLLGLVDAVRPRRLGDEELGVRDRAVESLDLGGDLVLLLLEARPEGVGRVRLRLALRQLVGDLLLPGLQTVALRLQVRDPLAMLLFRDQPGGCLPIGLRKLDLVDLAPHAVRNLVDRLGVQEDTGEAVVVLQPDRIELVVVTPDTAERHAEKGGADLRDLLVGDVPVELQLVDADDLHVAEHEEARGHTVRGRDGRIPGGQKVARDLLADESVVGLVGIEGVDDVVAIPPGVLGKHVVRGAHLVGIAGEIEPVPRPPFTEGSRGEQPVDDGGVGGRGAVGDVRGDLGGRGGQTREVEAHPPQPEVAIGIVGRPQALLLEPREQKPIDVVPRPRRVTDGGRRGRNHRLKGPMVPSLRDVDAALRLGPGMDRIARRRGGTRGDPAFEHRDLGRGKLSIRGHLQVGVDIPHGLHDEALVRPARHDRRARIAPLFPAIARIECETSLDVAAVGVAREAALLQQRQHRLGVGIDAPVGGRRDGCRQAREQHRHDDRWRYPLHC